MAPPSEPAGTAIPPAVAAVPGPLRPDIVRQAVAFAVAEAQRQAAAGLPVPAAAQALLRWASRRRAIIELAVAELRTDEAVSPEVRQAAVEILEQALAVGLLY